jgi:hypothetical protein
MTTHVKVLGVVFIVLSALGLLAAFMVAAVFSVAGLATAAAGAADDSAIALPIIGLAGTALSGFLFATSLPGFVAGIGLLNFKPWARTLAIVLSAINLINIPLGTIAGAYGLYVLLSEDGARLFRPVPSAAVP